MVTVSTSNLEQRAYHHGDLRAALLAAGLRALESTDISNISLRGLAREVGVSATAVYRHFPDKRALMEAMAREGLAQLGQMQQRAAMEAGDKAFSATGRAYVRFALANPNLFRLVFTHCPVRGDGLPEGNLAADMLLDSAARFTRGDKVAARRFALQSWALVHGLAMLMLDQQLPADEALIDQVIDGSTMWTAAS
jgi:AcrR family transcriptional regulator